MSIWNSIFGKSVGKKQEESKGKKESLHTSITPPSARGGSPEWKIGDLIKNRYEIHKVFRGGIGSVYICYDHQHRIPYALKTFQDRYLENQQARDRFF